MKRDCEGCGKQWEVSTTQSAEQTYICPVCARHRRCGAVSRMRNDNTSGYMGAFQRIWKAARPHVEIWGGCAIGMAAVWAMMYAFLALVGG